MIRIATMDDVETIVLYNSLLAKETENIDLNLDTLRKGVLSVIKDNTKGTYYVYEKEKKIIGQILITYEWSDWRNKNFWWIQSVYVDKEHRNNKVFSKIYEYILSLAKDTDVAGVKLYVDQNNENAQEVYSTLGLKKSNYHLFDKYLY